MSNVQSLGDGNGCAGRSFSGSMPCGGPARRRPPYSSALALRPTARRFSRKVMWAPLALRASPPSGGLRPSGGRAGSCCARSFLAEQVAEHRIDLRGFDRLAHREMRELADDALVFLPQVLLG